MREWLPSVWYAKPRRGHWLLPLSWLFAAAAGLRRLAYRGGLRARYRSPRTIVVVGNITAGGTGKTPLVLWLVEALRARGMAVGIVSRGYGGAGGPARRLPESASAAEFGDEPVLLQRRGGVPVAVGARRAEAVRLLEADCEVIVSDDGLQHYGLARDVEIAVVDGARGLGNGWRLPAGPLREPEARLHEVDAVVVNGEGFDWPGALRMTLAPTAVVPLAGGTVTTLAALPGRRVHAVAAIGHPARFFSMLRAEGLEVVEHPAADHARPELAQWAGSGLPVLVTEKDAVKWPRPGPPGCWYVEVTARLDGDAEALLDRIAARSRRGGA